MRVYLVLLFLVMGCASKKELSRFEGTAMTIPYTIQIGDPLDEKKNLEIERAILEIFSEVHQIYNNWNPQSEVSHLNQAKAHQKIPLSSGLASFLKKVDQIVQLTEGKFDPTVQKEHLDAIGWEKIHLEENFFWKEHDSTSIDLGGVAKGYAVDLIVEKLKEIGLNSIYVEWGGEIKTWGNHPEKRAWKVAIFGQEMCLELNNCCIATSGNYFQNWTQEGKTYTHIIDPFTKKPLEITPNSINSVSVMGESCLKADALATSFMLFPTKESATEWAQNHRIKIWIY